MAVLHRRRGSIYAAVLGCSLAVTVIGLSALLALRVERRFAEGTGDFSQARLYAYSAIEDGLFRIQSDPDWRNTYPNGAWKSDAPIGTGTYTLIGEDLLDSDLTDSDTDSILLTGIGTQGDARYKLQVRLNAEMQPLEALNTCLHASGEIQVKGGDSVTVTGAPLSTNGNLRNDEIVYGDAHAATLSGGGIVTGTTTVPAAAKAMPDPSVFDLYKSLATATPLDPDLIDGVVIAPGTTPWGVTNADGVYYIDTDGHDLHIKKSRVHGTLVVDAPGKKVFLEDPVFMHPARADYPVLIVNGDVEFRYKSDEVSLSETEWGTNYNPPGAPYDDVTDDDMADIYPNEVWDLVHVLGNLVFVESSRVRGLVICDGGVVCDKDNEIIHDPAIPANPPEGYATVWKMKISQGSWKQVVD